MVVLCCYGQGIEEDKEHYEPVKGLCFYVDQTLHPEETVPATGQAAKQKNNPALMCQVTANIACEHLHIYSRLTSNRQFDSCLPGRTGCLCLNLHWLKAGVLTRKQQV